MADFHALTSAHLGTGEPCADVVQLLKEYLARAERGEIIGLSVAYVEASNKIVSGWATGCASGDHMMLSVHDLHARVTQVWSKSRWDVDQAQSSE